ncbi:alpha-amylase family glycosyl hydrolase [Prochlorothrix hollandica]|nr:alpha-amylase family glycosyl hydrolase [Prochlorothrix hollandica]
MGYQPRNSWIRAILGLLLSVAFALGGLWPMAPGWAVPAADRPAAHPAVAGNLGNDVLYYIVVDRFLDGETDNNIPDFAFTGSTPDLDSAGERYNQMNRLLLRHMYDPSHRFMGMYWGGDLEGVIQRLDYLQDLGVTKLVLSPIQDNANGLFYHPNIRNYLHDKKGGKPADDFYRHISTAYHGYWTKDWFEIDEHLRNGTDQDGDRYGVFRRLLDEAGQRGLGVVLDLTMNQTSPGHISTEKPALGAGGFLFGESWFADNGDVYRHGQRVGQHWDPRTGDRDPDGWFHPPQIIWDFDTATEELLEDGQISGGMPDLDQSIPQVEQYFLDATRFWLTFNQESYPIAGFRLDAVKHVNVSFWNKFEDLVHEINPNAVLLGEFFGGGYRLEPSIRFLENTRYITQYDFNFSEAIRRYFAHDRGWDGRTYVLQEITQGHQGRYYNANPLGQLWHRIMNPAETLEVPREAVDAISDEEAKGWVTFIENHDQPRMFSFYPGLGDRSYASLIKYQFTARGVPLVMYGTETGLGVPYHPEHEGLFGIGGDPFNRPMMTWPNSPGWKPEIYDTTRAMAHLRQRCPVLRYGSTAYGQPKGSNSQDDVFMVRKAETAADWDPACPQVLYAYSTHGGEFLVSLDEGITAAERVETGQGGVVLDGLLPVRLEPDEAKVFILK